MSTHVKHRKEEGLANLFPPPQFLTTPASGVDITDSSVRFLKLKKTKNGKEIEKNGSYKIEPGVMKKGKIVDMTALIGVLSRAKEENNLDFIHASLPEEQAYLFQTSIPNTAIDEKQLKTILEFKLEENVPISSRELVFDYELVEEKTSNDSIMLNITAFPKEVAEGYVEAFRASGLTPLSFEIEAQSLARAVIPRHHGGTYMIVDFGKMRTGIVIVSEEVIRFTSTVSVGGNTLSTAIQKHFNVDKDEADVIKNQKGFARYKENKEVLETLLSTVSVLHDEVSRHYNYWNSHAGETQDQKINKIVLCGGSANLAGLSDFLETNLNVVVDVANVWANTFSLNDVVPDIDHRHSLAYASSVGLALKGIS